MSKGLCGEPCQPQRETQCSEQMGRLSAAVEENQRLVGLLENAMSRVLRNEPASGAVTQTPPNAAIVDFADDLRSQVDNLCGSNVALRSILDRLEI